MLGLFSLFIGVKLKGKEVWWGSVGFGVRSFSFVICFGVGYWVFLNFGFYICKRESFVCFMGMGINVKCVVDLVVLSR